MKTILRTAMLALLVGASGGLSASAQDSYPFVGEWDCEVATFVFTSTIYNNGSDDHEIQEIQEGSDGSYTVFLSDEVYITLGDFTGDSMTWLSSETGDSFSCRRL